MLICVGHETTTAAFLSKRFRGTSSYPLCSRQTRLSIRCICNSGTVCAPVADDCRQASLFKIAHFWSEPSDQQGKKFS